MIKRLSFLLMMAFVSAAILTSCSKDNDPEKYADYIVVNGQRITIYGGFMFYDTSPEVNPDTKKKYFRNLAYLTDDGIALSGNSGKLEVDGVGTFFRFEYIGSDTTVEAGSYTYTGNSSNLTPLNIYSAQLYVNYDVNNKTGDVYVLTSCAMTIEIDKDDIPWVNMTGQMYPALVENGVVKGADTSKSPQDVSLKLSTGINVYPEQ